LDELSATILSMTAKEELLKQLDRDINKSENSIKDYQMLKGHGNYPKQCDDQIEKYSRHIVEMKAVRETVVEEVDPARKTQ
jgi:hypothetical protein